jgi:hypothetical protein
MQINLFPELQSVAESPRQSKPESAEDIADRLTGEMLAKCKAIGVKPEAVALELKLREVSHFLSHYSPNDGMAFAVRLIEIIEENNRE